MRRACEHPFELAWCSRASKSPIKLLIALVEPSSHTFADGLPHPRHSQQVKRLAYGVPILFGQKDGIPPFPCNNNRLMAGGRLVNQGIEFGACFCSVQCSHRSPPTDRAYAYAYALSTGRL